MRRTAATLMILATCAVSHALTIAIPEQPPQSPPPPQDVTPAHTIRPDQTLIVPDDGPKTFEETAHAAEPPQLSDGQIPAALVDESTHIAFVPGEDGRVEALDLKTGKLLFASATPARPLAIANGNVYVLAWVTDLHDHTRQFVVRAMSIKAQGKYVFESHPLQMPDWLGTGAVTSLVATGSIHPDGLHILWAARGRETVMEVVGEKKANARAVRTWKRDGENLADEVSSHGKIAVNLTTGEVGEPKPKKAKEPVEGEAEAEADPEEELSADDQIREAIAKSGWFNMDNDSADPKWKFAAGVRDGLEYTLTEVDGEPQLTCTDPANKRVLWTRTLTTAPGVRPPLPIVESRPAPGDEMEFAPQMGGQFDQ